MPSTGESNYVVRIGESSDPQLVGGKGASLSRMKKMGLNVPDGLTITTEAWRDWKSGSLAINRLYNEYVKPLVIELFPSLGAGQTVSVRSGAAQSMPGMMETVLNVGAKSMNAKILYLMSLIRAKGMDESVVQNIIDSYLVKHNTFFVERLGDLELVEELADYAGVSMSSPYHDHIKSAIELVFESWNSPKAKSYRRAKNIPNNMGTACTIQLMVDGSLGYTGVMLTRGEIDWLPKAQGSAIVDGSHRVMNRQDFISTKTPSAYNSLVATGKKLEREYGDAVDIEFTNDGTALYYLQCRVAKRTPKDAMRMAVELYNDGVYTREQVMSVPVVDDSTTEYKATSGELLVSGIPINGKIVKGPAHIDPGGSVSKNDIVFREITTTSDIDLMLNSAAVVTELGGPSCHAALVARELNTTVVVGIGGMIIKTRSTTHKSPIVYSWVQGDVRIQEGDMITLLPDGSIYKGDVEFSQVTHAGEWSAKLSKLQKEIAGGAVSKPRRKTTRATGTTRTRKTNIEMAPSVEYIPF